ncbi:hypothetical protein MML48_9g00002701 [Holotrichia oblita]|uniref:Uncharacterized protein n=1 Tax=Holotrichia oblita TaxID=644536 RepID=A0ACB9SL55_HOLOL|nr:hypothetical protein MML48_9g00002701 [Holotrichia oblita]
MSYEAEQSRLQLLMDECMNFDIEFDDEEDTNEVDNLETFEEDTDTEQEVDDEDTVSETFEGPLFFGRDKKSKWRKHASTQKVKTRSKNIVTQLPGVRSPVKEVKEPLAIWKHFFDINMLNMIIDNTNKYIASVANYYSRDTYTRPTNLLEIQAANYRCSCEFCKIPRKEKPRTIRNSSEERMETAVLVDGVSIRQSANRHEIKYPTMRRYVEKRRENPTCRLTPNYAIHRIFTDEEEENIVKFVGKWLMVLPP